MALRQKRGGLPCPVLHGGTKRALSQTQAMEFDYHLHGDRPATLSAIHSSRTALVRGVVTKAAGITYATICTRGPRDSLFTFDIPADQA
jgi:hypothetical protein